MKHTMRSIAPFLCLALAWALPAQAAENGWYLVGFGGQSSASGVSPAQVDQNVEDIFEFAGLEIVSLTSEVDDSDTGFGFGGGYRFSDHFAVEAAYVDLGAVDYRADVTVTDGTDQADADVRLDSSGDGPVISALGILPIGERFSVFGRVGFSLLNAKGTARITVDGNSQRASQDSQKSDPVVGVGMEYELSRHFAVRLAWDRYFDVGTEDVTGDVDADLYTVGVRMNVGWFR